MNDAGGGPCSREILRYDEDAIHETAVKLVDPVIK